MRFLLIAEIERCSSPILILALYLSTGLYELITPFKTAIAHTLNEETEDPKNSLNKGLSVSSIHARKADTSGSRNMTLPDLSQMSVFGTRIECATVATALATRQDTSKYKILTLSK